MQTAGLEWQMKADVFQMFAAVPSSHFKVVAPVNELRFQLKCISLTGDLLAYVLTLRDDDKN